MSSSLYPAYRQSDDRGLTLIELVVSIAILSILASVALPLTKVTVKRARELELRQNLRILRNAIDQFKKDWDEIYKNTSIKTEIASDYGYPKSLEILAEGVRDPTDPAGKKMRKYLRRIPVDPITGSSEWKLRCYADEPDSDSWCGNDVFDVYSKSDIRGLDGTVYNTW